LMRLVLSSHSTSHLYSCFFLNDTAPTYIYTLSLHDALPISRRGHGDRWRRGDGAAHRRPPRGSAGRLAHAGGARGGGRAAGGGGDRKSTRLNSSHVAISYAVFCLKKKKKNKQQKYTDT